LLLVPCAILQDELESDAQWVKITAVEEILNCKCDSKVPNCKPYNDNIRDPVDSPEMRSTELSTGESKENTSRMSDWVRSTLKKNPNAIPKPGLTFDCIDVSEDHKL